MDCDLAPLFLSKPEAAVAWRELELRIVRVPGNDANLMASCRQPLCHFATVLSDAGSFWVKISGIDQDFHCVIETIAILVTHGARVPPLLH